MNKNINILFSLTLLSVFFVLATVFASEKPAWHSDYRKGMVNHENKEPQKAVDAFGEALKTIFSGVSEEPQVQDEKEFIKRFYDPETAALLRYQRGLKMLNKGNLVEAEILYRNALSFLYSQNAVYLGYKDGCKSCHFKEWKSWKDTKMAKAMDSLKPGGSKEIIEKKLKHNIDPKKDYTKDRLCLDCHTTGFEMPGGYVIPDKSIPYKIRKLSKQNDRVACECCHGPGSVYVELHRVVDDNSCMYKQEEFYAAGENEIKAEVCSRCHNLRCPVTEPGYKLDFEELMKKEGRHENFKLKYRIESGEKDGKKEK